MECAKVPSGARKVNKKQAKDELNRIKQAEKKKRRLEKALATSAAIRCELEKKKQKKKEQQRLDEEGAAIAEAVALHVLLGEDSEDQDKFILKEDKKIDPWDHGRNFSVLLGGRTAVFPQQALSKYSFEGAGSASGDLRYGCMWSHCGNTDWMASSEPWGRDLHLHYFDEGIWDISRISPDLLAAQGISSLHL